MTGSPPAGIAVAFAPGILIAFVIGMGALMLMRRLGVGRDDPALPSAFTVDDAAPAPP
jgi:hypothetical protein